MAIFAPLISPFPGDAGTATHPFEVLRAPSAAHWFGTDQVGRDIFSRFLAGARVSPVIAIVVLALACLVGIPLGCALPPGPKALTQIFINRRKITILGESIAVVRCAQTRCRSRHRRSAVAAARPGAVTFGEGVA